MTAQIHDTFNYEGEDFSITDLSSPLNWSPTKNLGLRPEMASTACWRGYQISLKINDSHHLEIDKLGIQLILRNMTKNRAQGFVGPSINGIHPLTSSGKGFDFFNNHYKGIGLKVTYSGKIEIASDFIDDMYVHMGFQHSNRYRKVFRLHFDEGRLIKEENISDEMEKERERLGDKDGLDGMREISRGRTSNLQPSEED